MTRRKLVALVGVFVLFAIGLVVLSTGLFVTRTQTGRDRLREIATPLINKAVKGGSVYIGHLSGNLISELTIDSIAIRDKRGELFLSTGPVTFTYNWRDIADQRILLRSARIEHPFVHIIQHENGNWNFKEIFASNQPSPPKPPTTTETRSWGSYMVIDSAAARNGTFLLSMPWHPDDTLHGAKLDSVIRVHLTTPQKMVARTYDGFARTYAWRNANALIPHVRLADPDSDRKYGQEFKIASLSVDEYEPTFQFRNVRGDVRHLGDSVWFQVPHFDMPASTGHGAGKVWWGSDLPVRYDVAVRGDSVSLKDVNWVYPTLPTTGGGTLDLGIKNDPKNLQIVDFRLQHMDVRSTSSHVTGDMWFGIGAPVLLVRNVDLRADPVNFDLIRTLNGKPFPEDWQGDLSGTVKGRGGPLTHFVVDDARGSFTDAHVRGAVSRFAGRGELDILNPAFTAFHGFNVDAPQIDLRTIEYLFPSFPRLGGFASGTATLDSSWLDVRFSNAHVALQDGPGEPSRFSGSGRITYGEPFMTYDVALNAEPISLTMLARSYPMLPPQLGTWTGPISARGSSPDLALNFSLQGSNGAVSYRGRIDIDSVGGMGATGDGQFSALNLAGLFQKAEPTGTISGHYDVDVSGETAATLRGSAGVELERTTLDSVRVFPSSARVHFADGRMIVDSLRLHTDAFTADASGGIGLPNGKPDSLHFRVVADSLGGLRAFISHPDTTLLGAAATPVDSLAGTLALRGDAVGTMDALRVTGSLQGSGIDYNKEHVADASVSFNIVNALASPSGSADVKLDSVTVGGIALDSVGGRFRLDDATHARFAVGALSRNGPIGMAAGVWSSEHGVQTVALDSLGLTIGSDRWSLANRPILAFDSAGMRLDSLLLRNRDTAFVAMAGNVPTAGQAFAQLHAAGIPLRDLGLLEQVPDTLYGVAAVSIQASGPKLEPHVDGRLVLSAVRYHGVSFDSVALGLSHNAGRVAANLQVVRNGRIAASGTANLPITISLFGMKPRNDTLFAKLNADSVDLSVLRLLAPPNALPALAGHLAAAVTASGTLGHPVFQGNVAVRGDSAKVAPLGVTFHQIDAQLSGGVNASGQDSIHVTGSARTNARDHVGLEGFVRNLAAQNAKTSFSFTVTADSLHAFNKRSVADLTVSTSRPVVLSGTLSAPVLTGAVNVDRGSIFLADRDLARKQLIDILIDTVSVGGAGGPGPFASLVNNLQVQNMSVTLGQDVRLRSTEANVRLAGQLEVVTSTIGRAVASTAVPVPGLTLAGQLTTVGGTYNLNLGLVQREFQVLPQGTVTFDGGPPETPLVDIHAQYNVKQYRDKDLGIIVNLTGRMPNPQIHFSSTADYDISQSDLLSYLIIGQPGFDFAAAGQQQVLASVLAPSVSAYAADRLRQSLGGWLDAFQFELGTSGAAEAQAGLLSQRNLSQYLATSTVSAEKQVTSNLYLSVNTGFCQLQNTRLALGAKVEYRFTPQISLQGAYDPPTATHCIEGQNIVGFVPTPSQWSISLLHSWRF